MASPNDLLKFVGQPGTATTLSGDGYSPGSDTITVISTSHWPSASGVSFAMDTVDSVTGDRVPGTYCEFDGVITSQTTIGGLNLRYGDPQEYLPGATTRVYIPVSSSRENDIVTWGTTEHNQNGTHSHVNASTINTADITVSGTVTVPNNSVNQLSLKKPIKGRFYRSADTVHGGTVWYVNVMDTVDYNFGGFILVNGGIQIPTTGTYNIQGVNSFQDGTVTIPLIAAFSVVQNGTIPNTPPTTPTGTWFYGNKNHTIASISISRSILLTAGDILYLHEYNFTAGDYRVLGGNAFAHSYLEIEYKGASS